MIDHEGDAHHVSPPPGAHAPRVAVILFASTLLLWLLLTGSLATQEIIAGVLVAAAATALATSRALIVGGLRLTPAAPLHMLMYLGVFFRALITSNIDVARRVLGPEAVLQSRWLWVPLDVRSPAGQAVLAGVVTLTPGTLSSEFSPDRRFLLVHALHCTDEAAMVAEIKVRYEAPLLEILG